MGGHFLDLVLQCTEVGRAVGQACGQRIDIQIDLLTRLAFRNPDFVRAFRGLEMLGFNSRQEEFLKAHLGGLQGLFDFLGRLFGFLGLDAVIPEQVDERFGLFLHPFDDRLDNVNDLTSHGCQDGFHGGVVVNLRRQLGE
ncbi:hypothetical protein D3C81_1402670 [compost metagenome]